MHHIKPSIGIGFKILVGAPLFFPLEGQTKGGVVVGTTRGIDHPIVFASRKLSSAERNYTTTKREGLAMVYAMQKFKHYLLGSHFKMFTDHLDLKFLVN